MNKSLLLCMLMLLGCHKPTDSHESLLSGNVAELQGWIHPWERVGGLPMLMASKGQEYGIENLPKELEERSVQIKAKAKFSRKMNSPGVTNQVVVFLSDIEPALPEIKQWDDMLAAEYKDPSKYFVALETFREEIGIPIPFWPTTQSERSADVVGFSMSGCGYLYKVFVKRLAKSLNNGSLASDDVFELNERGEIIRRWSIPGNDIVFGIQGDRLLVSVDTSTLFRSAPLHLDRGGNLFLAIPPDGRFRVVNVKDSLPDSVPTSCPAIKEFEGSAYTRCRIYKDTATGHVRRLAYQGPCT